MGRRSLATQRTSEIVEAFERCVAQYGLAASSLELVAEEAGVKRGMIRHYIGNRQDLIHALAEHVIEKYKLSFAGHFEQMTNQKPVQHLLSYLFPNKPINSTESIVVIESLIAESEHDTNVRKLISGYIDWLVNQSSAVLKQDFPHASRKKCWAVAYGIISICFNQESLAPLALSSRYLSAARSSADTLVDSLKS